jgi:hydrogenase nickel incorporation protein HypA/HybF
MHELAITQNVLEIALRHAEANGATRITDIFIVIGQLSSVVDDSVQFYWDMLCEGTKAEGAQLHFRRVQTRLRCQSCEHEYDHQPGSDLGCRRCGSVRVDIIAGQEFSMEAINIETQEPTAIGTEASKA